MTTANLKAFFELIKNAFK